MTQTIQLPTSNPQLVSLSAGADRADYARQLRAQTVAVRLSRSRLGVRKTLTKEQLREIADGFEADSKVLSAAKKILDTKDPSFKKVIGILRTARNFWRGCSTPYPEPAIRLLRRGLVDQFNLRMKQLQEELVDAVAALQEQYAQLRVKARADLGQLFNPADYPARVDGEFELDWDFPSIDPPAYLRELHPELYEQQCQRVQARFEMALVLTEQAFAEQFAQLVGHLKDRLSGGEDGKPKVFRDTAISNLNDFFAQVKSLDLGCSADLLKLVETAEKSLSGVKADELRHDANARARMTDELGKISQALDGMMTDRPERAIELED
jgi:hypothetical protein